MLLDPAYTTRFTPLLRAASSRLTVPVTHAALVSSGATTLRGTEASAAWWNTISHAVERPFDRRPIDQVALDQFKPSRKMLEVRRAFPYTSCRGCEPARRAQPAPSRCENR